MPFERLSNVLAQNLAELDKQGTRKGQESVITTVIRAEGEKGPRYLLKGEGDKAFLKMNSNNYLGMSLRPELIAAEEQATRQYGVGPGAVRFISGTYEPHVRLEHKLATFHQREAGMIFSSAYATVVSVIVPLITTETAIISDELNHNCIINAIRLARPKEKHIYKHLDLAGLETSLQRAATNSRRAIIVTDGIFSMRGDHAPLPEIVALAQKYDAQFPENVIVVVDDSHGVGAFGETGRGSEEFTQATGVDILVATLGKAFGVNGGYVVGKQVLIDYLRESSAMYIYSNPITPGEAAASLGTLEILESAKGQGLLKHLHKMRLRFKDGLVKLGYETLSGAHPVVPLMVRDTPKTAALVKHLYKRGILATGLNYPVVPKGDQSIRFQISADHTAFDIDYALEVLAAFKG